MAKVPPPGPVDIPPPPPHAASVNKEIGENVLSNLFCIALNGSDESQPKVPSKMLGYQQVLSHFVTIF